MSENTLSQETTFSQKPITPLALTDKVNLPCAQPGAPLAHNAKELTETHRTRPHRVWVRLDDIEFALLVENMAKAKIQNREAYIRKMILDGHIVQIDFSDVRKLSALLSNATNNLNQIAKYVNETHIVPWRDITAIRSELDIIWPHFKRVLSKLSKIK
jgi:hypothetical protein